MHRRPKVAPNPAPQAPVSITWRRGWAHVVHGTRRRNHPSVVENAQFDAADPVCARHRGDQRVQNRPKSLPSWYLVPENDEVIPPDAERQFAQRMAADTIEVASGHCAMVSHPEETHERIVTAANAAAVPG
jgi:pimeloyl-ACP methyl ester carboxylesterase